MTIKRNWNGWKEQNGVLYYPDAQNYSIPLALCTTSAAVLDRICQVSQKHWAGDGCLAGLVRALDDTLDPQRNLCPSGVDTVTLGRPQF